VDLQLRPLSFGHTVGLFGPRRTCLALIPGYSNIREQVDAFLLSVKHSTLFLVLNNRGQLLFSHLTTHSVSLCIVTVSNELEDPSSNVPTAPTSS
jgi:hypothetical protein